MRTVLDLVRSGQISPADYVAAVCRREEERPPLGQLAIEAGWIDPRRVMEIVQLQSRQPDRRFGEIAIERGILTREQVGALLLEQVDRQRPLQHHLRELGVWRAAEDDTPGSELAAEQTDAVAV